jgi:hypothetical protein
MTTDEQARAQLEAVGTPPERIEALLELRRQVDEQAERRRREDELHQVLWELLPLHERCTRDAEFELRRLEDAGVSRAEINRALFGDFDPRCDSVLAVYAAANECTDARRTIPPGLAALVTAQHLGTQRGKQFGAEAARWRIAQAHQLATFGVRQILQFAGWTAEDINDA